MGDGIARHKIHVVKGPDERGLGSWSAAGRALALAAALVAVSAVGAPAVAGAASGPVVKHVGETGASRGITGFRARFSRALDAERARDVDNYTFVGVRPSGKRVELGLESVKYKRGRRRVTVEVAEPFRQTRFRRLRIGFEGGPDGLADTRGRLLDGDRDGSAGGDALVRFRVVSGTTVRFRELDGDRAAITIEQGGHLDGIAPVGGPATQHTQFWIVDPILDQSRLSGSVTPAPARAVARASATGIVFVSEIIGLDRVIATPLLTNPSFRVNTLTFSSNATGIG
jgi:hypothetical protein